MNYLQIKNFRNIQVAQFPLDGVTLIAGNNHHGKSNTILAAIAGASGELACIPKIKKNQGHKYVKRGEVRSSILFGNQGSKRTMVYPDWTHATTGGISKSSKIAVGLINPITDKNKSSLFAQYLKSEPTIQELTDELKLFNTPETTTKSICDDIEKYDWDAVYTRYQEQGTRLKGQWSEVSGCNFGSSIVDSWLPEGFTPDMKGYSKETLTDEVSQAQEFNDQALKSQGVDDEAIHLLKLRISGLPDFENKLKDLQKERDLFIEIYDEAKKNHDDLPKPIITDECPCCGEPLEVGDGFVSKAEKNFDIDETNLMQEKITIAYSQQIKASRNGELNADEIKRTEYDINHISMGITELEALQANTGTTTSADVDKARNKLTEAKGRLLCFEVYSRSQAIREGIHQNQRIQKLLSPEGLRKQSLSKAVDGFNQQLSDISGWNVTIDDNLNIMLDEEDYDSLSESQQYACDLVIRTIFGVIDESPLIIYDRIDIFDQVMLGKFFPMVIKLKTPTLCAMKVNDRSRVINFKAKGFGCSYWIENGVLEEIV